MPASAPIPCRPPAPGAPRAAAWLPLLLAAVSLASARADDIPQASGRFNGHQWSFEARGAYAFPAPVGFDDEPGIRVAVSNAGFVAAAFDVLYDREHAIDELFVDDETVVVYLHFDARGKYAGLSYYFVSGDGCGFCYDGKTASTVRVEKGRIAGRVTLAAQEGEIDFDLSFDVPVAPSDYGEPLAGDYGEPGKAYAAYHRALVEGTARDLQPLLTPDRAVDIPEHGDQVHAAWRADHPTKSYRITRGFQRGNRALLLVEGENEVMRLTCEAHLLRNDAGVWQIDDELMKARL